MSQSPFLPDCQEREGRITFRQYFWVSWRGGHAAGSLPDQWAGYLPNIQIFDASSNQLSGNLPDSWGQNGSAFSQLQLLDVADNQIGGSLPSVWGANGGFNNLQ